MHTQFSSRQDTMGLRLRSTVASNGQRTMLLNLYKPTLFVEMDAEQKWSL